MNPEKLKQLQAQAANVRIGGKGSARRKKKVIHRTATTDDKKLQSSLKKLSVNNIPGIEEVNMIKDDGSVIHFNNPKVQASLAANTFAVTGHAENKQITEMLPGILNQLGADSLTHLKRLASAVPGMGSAGVGMADNGAEDDDDEVPDLVENFDEVSANECGTKSSCCPSERKAPSAEIEEVVEEPKAASVEPVVEVKEEPKAASEEPKAASEEPKAASEEPNAASEEPKAASEEPKAASEEPKAASEEPKAASEEPKAASEEPKAASEEPKAASEEPKAASEEPKAASEEPIVEAAKAEPVEE